MARVQAAPCLISDLVRWEDASPVEKERFRGLEGLVFTGGVGGFRSGGGVVSPTDTVAPAPSAVIAIIAS